MKQIMGSMCAMFAKTVQPILNNHPRGEMHSDLAAEKKIRANRRAPIRTNIWQPNKGGHLICCCLIAV